jgi:hypothetical protein
MAKAPNPNQIPMTKPQIPKAEGTWFSKIFFGIWSLGFEI